jgi:hypothetical protein
MWELFFWLMWMNALMQITDGATPPTAGQPQSLHNDL